ncbi:hypothetical protein E2C01_067504 [Portunus trituberculatus]|uniref:Uncharacterized protein n=1 Tax=Portunus trituberculatus TaxID=210409 RepID=A0A5B7HTT1_PORTR|nr:hypothetical protein [Portunus trituberculatus]
MIKQSQELMERGGIGMIDDEDEEEETDKNKVTLNCGSATVEICDLDLTSKHHIDLLLNPQMETSTSYIKSNDKQVSSYRKSVPEKEDEQQGKGEEEEEDVSPENLDRLGIHSHRDLVYSLKKSSAMVLKRSKLIKQKQMRDATKQKKAQARENNRRRKLKSKKMRHKRTSNKE